jgi:hypothetical protein
MTSWGRYSSRYSTLRDTRLTGGPALRDASSGVDISLGNRKFGSATVDCCFLNRKSKWGVLHQKPAGILLLDLTFSQPAEYKLSNANLQLSFLKSETGAPPIPMTSPLNITEYIAPIIVCGPPNEQRGSREVQFQPEVGADGLFNIGGVGYKSTKEILDKHRWIFRSHRLPNDNGIYTNAQWLWEANPSNKQIELLGPLHVGVAIEHTGQPFIVSLKIQGKLRSKSKRLRFGFREEETPPTKRKICPKQETVDIEREAESLRETMKNANTIAMIGKEYHYFNTGLNRPSGSTPTLDED